LIDIIDHLPEAHVPEGVRLYYTGLEVKLGPVFGPLASALDVLPGSIHSTRCLTALSEGRLAGILGIHDQQGSFLEPSYGTMVRHYGQISGTFRTMLLMLLDHKVPPGDLYLDGIVLKRSWAGEIKNVSILVAIGVDQDGYRTILGVQEGHKEDKSGWSGFLEHLKARGLKGVRLVISDACMGLIDSVAEYYPDADWQRCTVHFYRNVFSHVPRNKTRDVAAMLKAIHAQESREAAVGKASNVVDQLRQLRLGKAAELVEAKIGETLTYYAYPPTHWIKLRTNNPMERIMREIRRRTRVVGAFPDGKSCLNLAAARLRHIAGTQWSTRKYINMKPLFADQTRGAVVA